MDLNHFAQRWQQQASPALFTPGPPYLPGLIAGGANGPVARMLRNLWMEIAALLLMGTPILLGLLQVPGAAARLLAGLVAVLYAGSVVYYGSKLLLLHRLSDTSGPLRTHLQRQVLSLRRLLTMGFRATMGATLLAGAGLAYAALHYGWAALAHPAEGRFVLWLALTVLVSYLITYWCVQWHLQYSYGQHLERLEKALQELQD